MTDTTTEDGDTTYRRATAIAMQLGDDMMREQVAALASSRMNIVLSVTDLTEEAMKVTVVAESESPAMVKSLLDLVSYAIGEGTEVYRGTVRAGDVKATIDRVIDETLAGHRGE